MASTSIHRAAFFGSDTFYRRVFLAGAIWNLAGGAFIVAATGWIFATAGLPTPSPPMYYQSWIALFIVFGVGYYLVARDLDRNRDIALLGGIGKLAFAAIFLYHYIASPGQAPAFFWIPLIGDVVFAVLFLRFYAQRARMEKAMAAR